MDLWPSSRGKSCRSSAWRSRDLGGSEIGRFCSREARFGAARGRIRWPLRPRDRPKASETGPIFHRSPCRSSIFTECGVEGLGCLWISTRNASAEASETRNCGSAVHFRPFSGDFECFLAAISGDVKGKTAAAARVVHVLLHRRLLCLGLITALRLGLLRGANRGALQLPLQPRLAPRPRRSRFRLRKAS